MGAAFSGASGHRNAAMLLAAFVFLRD